ncbi:acyltransferase [Agarivorans sp. Z349TD_8]|uniref:acyltransferase n=1 Tax=Agarivorans sp. Z349TD_8 TaxID=3421434 RepID=UPI003D7E3E5B
MSYYSRQELLAMGFKHIGCEVKISKKASIYDCASIVVGDYSRIDDFCVISGRVILGRNVHLAPFCLIAGGSEGVEFGDFSGCAYHVQVFSQSDDYSGETLTNPTVPAQFKREIKRKVIVGKHVIIGAGSIIFPGVQLAEGCAIGAMSLVRKTTAPWFIYLGNPAKKFKARSKKLLALEKQYLEL